MVTWLPEIKLYLIDYVLLSYIILTTNTLLIAIWEMSVPQIKIVSLTRQPNKGNPLSKKKSPRDLADV